MISATFISFNSNRAERDVSDNSRRISCASQRVLSPIPLAGDSKDWIVEAAHKSPGGDDASPEGDECEDGPTTHNEDSVGIPSDRVKTLCVQTQRFQRVKIWSNTLTSRGFGHTVASSHGARNVHKHFNSGGRAPAHELTAPHSTHFTGT